MFEKLEGVALKYEDLSRELMSPDVASDPKRFRALMKEQSDLAPLVEAYQAYKKAGNDVRDAQMLLEEESDEEMRALAKEELAAAKEEIAVLEEKLRVLLLPKDPNDDKNVIVEIRAGAGGDEAALFAGEVYRMYVHYAEGRGWRVETVSFEEIGIGGMKSVSFIISGKGAYSRLKYESGVHRVQRVPETESQGRIHTSTVTVAVLVEADEVELEINPTDLKIDYFRASGAGGQHINKTESAVRITYLPTNTVVECQDERSQHKNKDKAMKILRSRIYEAMQEEHDAKIASERKMQVGTGDRSERIRTYNYPQGRLTDHRIGLTIYRLDDILNGNIDEVFDALATADQAAKLANQEA